MQVAEVTAILEQLEAGVITWEQALVQVTSLPTPWQTKEWKQRREALIGTACAVCQTTEGPFVLQHLMHCDSFKEHCQAVKAEFRQRLWPVVIAQVTKDDVAAHIGLGEPRLACPTCGSISLRERKTMYPPYLCQFKGCPQPLTDKPVPVRYYLKQKTTDRLDAMSTALPFLQSVAMVAELRKHDNAIQHEATLRSLRQSLEYRSLRHTATYCKVCAFKEDLPVIERKAQEKAWKEFR